MKTRVTVKVDGDPAASVNDLLLLLLRVGTLELGVMRMTFGEGGAESARHDGRDAVPARRRRVPAAAAPAAGCSDRWPQQQQNVRNKNENKEGRRENTMKLRTVGHAG